MKIKLLIGTAVIALLLVGSIVVGTDKTKVLNVPGVTRSPLKIDLLYASFAQELNDATPCAYIAPSHAMSFGFSPAGKKVSAIRSRCYEFIALNTGDESLCEGVYPVSTLFLSGSANNEEACRESARANRTSGLRGGVGSALLNPYFMLRLVGYDHEKATKLAELAFLPFVPSESRKQIEALKSSIRAKLKALPDLSNDDAVKVIKARFPECFVESAKKDEFCEQILCYLQQYNESQCETGFESKYFQYIRTQLQPALTIQDE